MGASETALNIFLLDKLREFHTHYPGIRLRISNHSTPQAIAALNRGTVDFAVVTTPTGASKPLHETLLHPFHEILIGGRGFAELAEDPLHLKALENYPLICLGRDTMTYAFYHQLFLQYGMELKPETEAATADQILPLVKCDLGLAFLPEEFAEESLERGEVFKIPLIEQIPQRQISLIRDSRRPLSIAAKEFWKMLCLSGPVHLTGR